MIHSGIARQRWIDPLDNFVRDHGRQTPRWAIICTYGCDPDVLERQVLPRLNRRGRAFRTLVLADAGELEVQLAGKSTFRPRNQVNLHPVRVRGGGIFHPKIVFLRAGAHARVCFGSANISVVLAGILSCGPIQTIQRLWVLSLDCFFSSGRTLIFK